MVRLVLRQRVLDQGLEELVKILRGALGNAGSGKNGSEAVNSGFVDVDVEGVGAIPSSSMGSSSLSLSAASSSRERFLETFLFSVLGTISLDFYIQGIRDLGLNHHGIVV